MNQGRRLLVAAWWSSQLAVGGWRVALASDAALERTAGDDCETPIVIYLPAQLPYQILNQTTCGRGNDYSATCLGAFDGGEDIVFELHVAATVDVTVTMDPKTSLWTGLVVDDACPPAPANCLAKTSGEQAMPRIISPLHLTPGTYWIMVDTWPAPNCITTFDLFIVTYVPPTGACCLGGNCIGTMTETNCAVQGGEFEGGGSSCVTWRCQPADSCAAAALLSVPDDVQFQSADLTTDATPACGTANGGVPDNNAWFLLPGTGHTLTITTCAAGTLVNDAAVKVYCDCPALTCVSGNDDDPNCSLPGSLQATVTFCSQAGVYYYVTVGPTGPPVTTIELLVWDDETPCTGAACAPDPQACCFVDGHCELQTMPGCNAAGGTYVGGPCVSNPCPQPVPGDACLLPIAVALPPADWPFQDTNHTCGRGNEYQATCLGHYDEGEDVIYRLDVEQPCTINAWLNPLGTPVTGIVLDDACPPGLGDCLAFHTATAGVVHGLHGVALSAGTYYVMIDTWPLPSCIAEFELLIEPAGALGACCLPGPICRVLSAAACAMGGGAYRGNGIACEAVTCGCPGDCNCDGTVDFDDLNPFVDALAGGTPCQFENCDVNGDGLIDFDDINPLVDVLSSRSGPCP